jgi:hypothetical protein
MLHLKLLRFSSYGVVLAFCLEAVLGSAKQFLISRRLLARSGSVFLALGHEAVERCSRELFFRGAILAGWIGEGGGHSSDQQARGSNASDH